ncbi:MAG: SMC-Scp complex subunit ScpB [Patescibacteria group bacterium]
MALSLSSRLEALLFAAGEPMTKKRLIELLDATPEEIGEAFGELAAILEGRGLALVRTEDAVTLRTAPEAAADVKALRDSELSRDLGKASLETLALILYKGGATRGEIDWVRGVNSAAALRVLTLRGLVERVEDPLDKRRARYAATVDALAHLGASSVADLPRYAEFSAALTEQDAKREAVTADEV